VDALLSIETLCGTQPMLEQVTQGEKQLTSKEIALSRAISANNYIVSRRERFDLSLVAICTRNFRQQHAESS
jgi:hypothetical protein